MPTFTHQYKFKQAAVIGLARTGLAACDFWEKKGIRVFCWDDYVSHPNSTPITNIPWNNLDACLITPIIPLQGNHPAVALANKHNVPIISDLDLFWETHKGPSVGITGTVSKSTTTLFLSQHFQLQGKESQPCGNFGAPPIALKQQDLPVIEISSAQLERMHQPNLSLSVILNILEDHIDHHGSLEKYINAKMRIFELTQPSGTFVFVTDLYPDSVTIPSKAILLSSNPQKPHHVLATPSYILDKRTQTKIPLDIPTRLKHIKTLPIACALAYIAEEKFFPTKTKNYQESFTKTLKAFSPLEHRCELFFNTPTVQAINDSKATNTFATQHALSLFSNILWIAGGQRKSPFEWTPELLQAAQNVTHLFLIGKQTEDLASELSKHTNITVSHTLSQAVCDAQNYIQKHPGEKYTLLLSPLATSFDQFQSFVERGNAFKEETLKHFKKEDACS